MIFHYPTQHSYMKKDIIFSIDHLSLYYIRLGVDHTILKHDSIKSDQGEETLIDKHCYENPKDPQCCLNTLLGIWLCLHQEIFDHSELIFRNRDAKDESTSAKYCNQLAELLRQHSREVMTYCKKASAHGIRKDSATAVSSGTILPPPIASISAWVDWLLGQVLDINWEFSEPALRQKSYNDWY